MWWLTYNIPKGICVVLQPGSDLMQARFTADVLKLAPGEFKEGHKLDAKTIKRVPRDLVGKSLSARQAQQLLAKLAK